MTWGSTRCRPDGSCPASRTRRWAMSPSSGSASPGSGRGPRPGAAAHTVVGVCIPWFGSRTEARRGRGRWEDHAQYLDGLRPVLEQLPRERVIVIGDFNQTIGPCSRAPAELRRALYAALPPGMRIITSDLALEGRDTIDRVALTADMAAESVSVISHLNEGEALSDHFGVIADVSARRTR